MNNELEYNIAIAADNGKALIEKCDDDFSARLHNLSDKIAKNTEEKIIFISGPSASGKTTFSHRLARLLAGHGIKTHVISMDDYFVNRELTPVDEYGIFDYETPENVNYRLLNNHFERLLAGETILRQKFDFIAGESYPSDETLSLGSNDVLLVEGIHALNDIMSCTIPTANKHRIYIRPEIKLGASGVPDYIDGDDLRKMRRIIRDERLRGCDADGTLHLWNNIERGEREYIFKFASNADDTFNTALMYEPGFLHKFGARILHNVPKSSDKYSEAMRLYELFNGFNDPCEDYISRDSLLLEFIPSGT